MWVCNFRQKNYSPEDGLYGEIGLFQRYSGCSAEQKTHGIPFRTVPQRRKMLAILHHGTKIEANSCNSVPNHSAVVKTTRNSVPKDKKRNKLSEFCSKDVSEENIVFTEAVFFVKQIFFIPFPSVPSLGTDSSIKLGMSTFFLGITETILSLFLGIFSERNSVANPIWRRVILDCCKPELTGIFKLTFRGLKNSG
jgi:hypothetical protein